MDENALALPELLSDHGASLAPNKFKGATRRTEITDGGMEPLQALRLDGLTQVRYAEALELRLLQ
jgi:hypothetical protein